MKQRFFIVVLLICIITDVSAQVFDTTPVQNQPGEQEKEETSIFDHFYFGGNLGAQFGIYTFVNVAPLIGYKITDRLSVGTRVQYQYFRFSGFGAWSSHVFGGSLFTRYFVFDNFFLHGEYEVLNGYFNRNAEGRTNIPHLFLGGGYLFPVSDNIGLGISAMYEVLQNTYSPYRNPMISAGITVGL